MNSLTKVMEHGAGAGAFLSRMCHPRSMSSTLQAHLSASVKPGRSGRGAVGRPECLAGARPIPGGSNGQRRGLSGLAPCRRYYLGCPLSSDFLCQIGLETSIYSLGMALGEGEGWVGGGLAFRGWTNQGGWKLSEALSPL